MASRNRQVCYTIKTRWVGLMTGHMEVQTACGRTLGSGGFFGTQSGRGFSTQSVRKVSCVKCMANMPPAALVALHQELRNK